MTASKSSGGPLAAIVAFECSETDGAISVLHVEIADKDIYQIWKIYSRHDMGRYLMGDVLC